MAHLTVLSHSSAFYATRRLIDAARGLGHRVSRVDPVRVVIAVGPDGPRIEEDGHPVEIPRVVMPRVGVRLQRWGLDLLEAYTAAGARCPVRAGALALVGDKIRSQTALAAAGVPVLPSVALRETWHVEDALDAIGGDAFVLKLRRGTGGQQVVLAPDRRAARSMLGALISRGEEVLVQPFVEPLGRHARDLRVLIARDEPLAACWRVAPADEFRANVHRGGRTEVAELSAELHDLAVFAAKVLDLPFCGVDILETVDGPIVLEVNGSPGFEGIEAAHDADLATPYVERFMRSS